MGEDVGNSPSGAIPFFAKIRLCLINLALSNPHLSMALGMVVRHRIRRQTSFTSHYTGSTHIILLTSSTPSSSNPILPSPLPSPMFSSRSNWLDDIPAAAWSEKEKVERGV